MLCSEVVGAGSNNTTGVIFLITVGICVVGMFIYYTFTETGKAAAKQIRKEKAADPKGKPLSQVGLKPAGTDAGSGGLACPKCHGTQFKVQRKTSTKIAFGAASLLGNARWVRCVTCGERYRRA